MLEVTGKFTIIYVFLQAQYNATGLPTFAQSRLSGGLADYPYSVPDGQMRFHQRTSFFSRVASPLKTPKHHKVTP